MSLGWIDEICTRVTKELVDTNKPFKYLGKTLYFRLLFPDVFFSSKEMIVPVAPSILKEGKDEGEGKEEEKKEGKKVGVAELESL